MAFTGRSSFNKRGLHVVEIYAHCIYKYAEDIFTRMRVSERGTRSGPRQVSQAWLPH